MLVDVASIAHIDNSSIEHSITDFIKVTSSFRLQLHEHLFGMIWRPVTMYTHAPIHIFAFSAAQSAVFLLITLSLFKALLEIINSMGLHPLFVFVRWV